MYTALATAAALALGAMVVASPSLILAGANACEPPPDLPSAPWTAALLFVGVAGAAAVLVKRGRGGGTGGAIGGGLAVWVAISVLSGGATALSTPGLPAHVTASADTCPPSPSATPS